MGNPNYDARLKKIEAEQTAQAEKQAKLEAELQRQRSLFAATTSLLDDYNRAMIFLQTYMNHFVVELAEHGMMVSSATTKFGAWLSLPPTSSQLNLFADFAFTALATVLPVFRATGLLAAINKNASRWNEAAALQTALTQMNDRADGVKKANDTRMKAAAFFSAATSSSVNVLERLDTSKTPIKALRKIVTEAATTFDNVANAIASEFSKRLRDPRVTTAQTLTQLAQSILVPPDFPSESELDEIETRFLWEMVSSYCRKNVRIVENAEEVGAKISDIDVKGINDTQRKELFNMFFSAPRGRYFQAPKFFYSIQYLYYMKVPVDLTYIPPDGPD